jgi:hypothetical protein
MQCRVSKYRAKHQERTGSMTCGRGVASAEAMQTLWWLEDESDADLEVEGNEGFDER